jgi:MFS family permease
MRTAIVLAALRFQTYRRFWAGSLVANVGFWMQQTALGWLVYDMTGAASWLGTIALAANAPTFVLGLLGGAIADRASRRTIILSAQIVLALGALTLAWLTASGHLGMGHVIAVTMLGGTAAALWSPAMMSVMPTLVPAADMLSAVSLNSVQFNLARTIGPAVAGLSYGVIGAAGCFTANAAGFAIFTLVMSRLPLPRRPQGAPPPLLRALVEGLRYVRRHPVIGPSLALALVMSVFGFPYIILLPALAGTLGLGVSGLGYLTAAVGCGAVAGGLWLSAAGDHARKLPLANGSAIAFGATLASLAVIHSVVGVGARLALLGVLQTACVASINTTIQLTVEDRMRGRVLSMLTVILFGFATLGAVLGGVLGDRIGVPNALAAGGVVIVIAASAALLRAPALPGPARVPAPTADR